jgi:hypothetical protein
MSICWAQQPPGGGAQGSSRATQLPLSDGTNQSGSVTTQQSPAAGTGPATIDSSIQIGGNFAGSVPTANILAGPVKLTLARATGEAESNLADLLKVSHP